MLNSIAALLKIMSSKASSPGFEGRRFWAQVLQNNGDSALLESSGEKFSAILQTAVNPGEKLLLEQLFAKDNKLYCKILQQQPAAEPGNLPNNSFYLFWQQRETLRTPYLLTATEEEGRLECAAGGQQWSFTLYTENLGAVTILARYKQGCAECSILVDNEDAASSLAHLIDLFSPPESSTSLLTGIRIVKPAGKSNTSGTGGCLDHVR